MSTKYLRNWFGCLALALAAMLVIAGCGSSGDDSEQGGDDGESRTVETADGPVEIPANPERIVALRGAAEILLSLGVPLVGAPDGYTEDMFGENSEAWAAYEELPVTGAYNEPDYEKILNLEPDLIIGGYPDSRWQQDTDAQQLEAIAPTVNISFTDEDDAWKKLNERVAEAVGATDALEAKIAEYDDAAAAVAEKHADKIEGTRFAAIAGWAPGSFYSQLPGSYTTYNAEDAGLDFPVPPGIEQAQELSLEELGYLADYDVIMYPVEADGTPTEDMKAILDSATFKVLPAAAEGKLLAVSSTGGLTYDAGIAALASLDEQLAALPA